MYSFIQNVHEGTLKRSEGQSRREREYMNLDLSVSLIPCGWPVHVRIPYADVLPIAESDRERWRMENEAMQLKAMQCLLKALQL